MFSLEWEYKQLRYFTSSPGTYNYLIQNVRANTDHDFD